MNDVSKSQDVQRILDEAQMIANCPFKLHHLNELAEKFDLGEARFAQVARDISHLIWSDDPDLRCETVQALCSFRLVDGYEWVAIEGWKRSRPADIHDFETGVINAYRHPEVIELKVVMPVADYIYRRQPARNDYADQYDFDEAMASYAMVLTAACDVMEHLFRVLMNMQQLPASVYRMSAPFVQVPPKQWKMIAHVLFQAAHRESHRPTGLGEHRDGGNKEQ